ncbi:hypothetical protein [Undibacterium umbellatum]|uniref:Uncharacterized protein n=1 Tax=Undibacterium umbellatum TaxID=2762300 RepID=A0ABR6ZGX9_9BURK|nr:hypothetical protein [Undibacterium umbellatum]MBC3910826.1 hypothetical protein [Undibacterium umbellatum]
MDLGYGQDMIRFREFLPERPDLISVISDPSEFAKSDSLRAQRAGYRGSDFDLYDFNASGSKLGRVALQEQKNSTSHQGLTRHFRIKNLVMCIAHT